ncbi:MAG: DUF1080 domain-containing protein [Pirellulales bacterium]|nr:DUF1080 domain-containing protein [Pirellulales bacterium]
MRNCLFVFCLAAFTSGVWTTTTAAADLVARKTESGTVVGYKDTPPLPWTDGKYCVHDPDRPVPKYVEPMPADAELPTVPAPADAIVLFDGKDVSRFKSSVWEVADDSLVAGDGSLETAEAFGDFQLHLQWMVPKEPGPQFMNRGNSGVLLMGRYELQVFDSHPVHPEQIYPDGQAASVYGQTPPLVNACRLPGQWQSFDIVFRAPVFQDDKLVKRATVTVLHNGVLVHDHQEIMGPMAHRQVLPYEPHPPQQPLVLQGHGCPVRFRNIWLRPLDR